jgi:transcriptional accessory protein Tex/SPT6
VTATPILDCLSREFSAHPDHVRNALEMIDAGLSTPFIGRYRREQVGGISESFLRRIQRRRTELDELDRRRGTVLRMLEKEAGIPAATIEAIQRCTDRYELEDLFIPHRRPEPEVQLALDRGLGALADHPGGRRAQGRARGAGHERASAPDEREEEKEEDDVRPRAPRAQAPLPRARPRRRRSRGEPWP